MANPYLFQALEAGPVIFSRLCMIIGETKVDEKTDPERFTLRYAIAHLADWEEIQLGRMRAAVESPGTMIEAFDEVLRAEEQSYSEMALDDCLRKFAERRKETIAYLNDREYNEWPQTVYHPERRWLSLYDLANLMVAHDTYHIEHLTQFLA